MNHYIIYAQEILGFIAIAICVFWLLIAVIIAAVEFYELWREILDEFADCH